MGEIDYDGVIIQLQLENEMLRTQIKNIRHVEFEANIPDINTIFAKLADPRMIIVLVLFCSLLNIMLDVTLKWRKRN